ncbi:MAG: glutamine-hydrolyzing GMP synthase [Oscillospiraceae bacterium]|jgi:GMP synthase (glutamine-hydrolysing)|nr:glutamine-hydrolyzing GMP synthase [Oscillospiraceae bacterium]
MKQAGKQLVLVLDFGGQYKELIARRVRELNVYSEIRSGAMSADEIRALQPDGLILTGGPSSVYLPNSQLCDPRLFDLGIPVLGICYGMHLMAHTLGGVVGPGGTREYGVVRAMYHGEPRNVLMSHFDCVKTLPDGFVCTGSTDICEIAAFENAERRLYATQFHPEVTHTERGSEIIADFLFNVCGLTADYFLADIADRLCQDVRRQVGSARVLLALSGGVDSAVVAALLSKAVPGQTKCVFVDHGLMRQDEGDQIERVFGARELEFRRVNAADRFLTALAGQTDPETKRKLIGEEFIKTFIDTIPDPGEYFFAQGTIYPDVIESGFSQTGDAAVIKSHHNVGGLPEEYKRRFLGITEPLRGLFKDEVRQIGRMLGLPDALVERQPFPGPGLGIRIIGDITQEKLDILRRADAIFRAEVDTLPFAERPDQYFAVLTNLRTVGVTGDERSYGYLLALRAVQTDDFMTCKYTKLPHELLDRASQRITNEIREIGRVVYDITDKPPATLEWE